ncbi:premnaspirodiene oxygenase-like [Olea europaea subsp. europaea]|uniref:Premnaspirodiene oxygenase-like n=1 Tax=Olea europaea subsp. europaea TaxID=158383 RepID=A0A8S0PTM3_OLEEU|nr:premnaspirodiene oxygenase-like [Olea europaea subsp. europaea]
MDLYFPFSFTTFTLFLPFVLLFLTKWKKSKDGKKLEKLPPGPKKLPIIGHIHLVSSLPHRSFRDLAKIFGPLMHLKLRETSTIVVSSPKIAKENHAAISFSPYDEYWRQMRRICILELLSAKQVKSFGSIRSDEVLNLVKSIRSSAGKPINLTEKIISTMSATTCRAAFGKVCKDKEKLIKIMRKALALSGGFDLADLFPSSKVLKTLSSNKLKLLAMRRKLDEILDVIIEEHKENLAKISNGNGELDQTRNSKRKGNGEFGDEDLVDVFLRVKESGELQFPIDNEKIKAVISLSICMLSYRSHEMFSAGTESSSSTINWTMAELMRNPRVMAKAQAEVRETFNRQKTTDTQNLKYLKLVIKETLRLHSPPLIPRANREDCEVNGYFIPANAKVFVNTWEIGRDPKTNPESFQPERFENNPIDLTGNNFEYLPFGSGRRICTGLTFGLAGVELPLAQLLYNFDWKLPEGINPDNLNMIENSGMTASRKEDLYLFADPFPDDFS